MNLLLHPVIYLPETKNSRARNVFLNAKSLAVLEALRDEWDGKNPYVFPTKTGAKKPHLTEVRKTFSGACQEGGIGDFHLHDLRHSFGAMVVSNGGTLYEAQQLLGHLDQTTTLRYAHLSQDALRKASQRVAEQIEKAAV